MIMSNTAPEPTSDADKRAALVARLRARRDWPTDDDPLAEARAEARAEDRYETGTDYADS